MTDEALTGAAPAATESTPAPVETTPAPAPTEAAPPPDLDSELSQIYDRDRPPRDDGGRFASQKPPEAQAAPADKVTEGTPASPTPEQAITPAIEAPISMPSALKDEWAKVPPAAQEWVAKREAEAHRQITQLGQTVKAFEPVAKLVENYRDIFQNTRRNVSQDVGLAQLMEAQRQLDRDPYGAISHIARAHGVDLSVFASQDGQQSNQSPHVASLEARLEQLSQRNAQLEQRLSEREQREVQTTHQALQQTVDEYLKENPIDDDLSPEVEAQITALKLSSPHLSPRDLLKAAHERAMWSNPARRQQLIAKERAAEEARRAEESAKRASEAKRAASVNVRSTPGNARPARSLDDELSAIYDKARSA